MVGLWDILIDVRKSSLDDGAWTKELHCQTSKSWGDLGGREGEQRTGGEMDRGERGGGGGQREVGKRGRREGEHRGKDGQREGREKGKREGK